MSISKSAIKIFELFHARPEFELYPVDMYLVGRDKLGIPEATQQQIHDDFLWLERKGLIGPVLGKPEWYRLTDLGKSILPEDLIWENQKEYHDELLERNRKGRMWKRREWASMFLLLCVIVAFISLDSFLRPILEDGTYKIILSLTAVLLFPLLIAFEIKSGKFWLSNEEVVFVNIWEAYQSLRAYESKGEEAILEQAVDRLKSAAATLQARQPTPYWDLVQNRIYGTFRKLGTYITSMMIPAIKQKKIREALRQIVTITSLFKERDISGLLSFIEGLGKIEMLARRRRISLVELRSKPLRYSFVLMGMFVIIDFAGFYLVSVIQGQPLISYATGILTLGFMALVGVVTIILRR